MKKTLHALVKSLYDFEWIGRQKHNTTQAKKTITLFIGLVFVVVCVNMYMTVSHVLHKIKHEIEVNTTDFVFTSENNELTVSGLEQPSIHSVFLGKDPEKEEYGNVVFVIDTISEYPRIADYRTDDKDHIVLLSKKEFLHYDAFHKTTQEVEVGFGSQTMTKKDILDMADLAISRTIFIALLLSFFSVLLMFLWKFVHLLLLVYIIYLYTKKKWAFSQLYTIGLYAIIFPTILLFVIHTFAIVIPYGYTVVLVIILMLALRSAKKLPENSVKDVS